MDGEMIVTVGVDTHTDVHVAAVLDQAGRLLGTASFPATTRGYAQLATWAEVVRSGGQGRDGRNWQFRRRAVAVPGRLWPGRDRGRPPGPL